MHPKILTVTAPHQSARVWTTVKMLVRVINLFFVVAPESKIAEAAHEGGF